MSTSSSSPDKALPRAPVVGVQESLVTIDVSQTPVMKNEVGYVVCGEEHLKAEVLRVQGDVADMQVFDDTAGVKVGDPVEIVQKYGERLVAVHLKDWIVTDPDVGLDNWTQRGRFCELGAGNIGLDNAAVLHAIREGG